MAKNYRKRLREATERRTDKREAYKSAKGSPAETRARREWQRSRRVVQRLKHLITAQKRIKNLRIKLKHAQERRDSPQLREALQRVRRLERRLDRTPSFRGHEGERDSGIFKQLDESETKVGEVVDDARAARQAPSEASTEPAKPAPIELVNAADAPGPVVGISVQKPEGPPKVYQDMLWRAEQLAARIKARAEKAAENGEPERAAALQRQHERARNMVEEIKGLQKDFVKLTDLTVASVRRYGETTEINLTVRVRRRERNLRRRLGRLEKRVTTPAERAADAAARRAAHRTTPVRARRQLQGMLDDTRQNARRARARRVRVLDTEPDPSRFRKARRALVRNVRRAAKRLRSAFKRGKEAFKGKMRKFRNRISGYLRKRKARIRTAKRLRASGDRALAEIRKAARDQFRERIRTRPAASRRGRQSARAARAQVAGESVGDREARAGTAGTDDPLAQLKQEARAVMRQRIREQPREPGQKAGAATSAAPAAEGEAKVGMFRRAARRLRSAFRRLTRRFRKRGPQDRQRANKRRTRTLKRDEVARAKKHAAARLRRRRARRRRPATEAEKRQAAEAAQRKAADLAAEVAADNAAAAVAAREAAARSSDEAAARPTPAAGAGLAPVPNTNPGNAYGRGRVTPANLLKGPLFHNFVRFCKDLGIKPKQSPDGSALVMEVPNKPGAEVVCHPNGSLTAANTKPAEFRASVELMCDALIAQKHGYQSGRNLQAPPLSPPVHFRPTKGCTPEQRAVVMEVAKARGLTLDKSIEPKPTAKTPSPDESSTPTPSTTPQLR